MSLFVQKQGRKGSAATFVREGNRFGGDNSNPDGRYDRRCKLTASERDMRREDSRLRVATLDPVETPICPYLGSAAPKDGCATIDDCGVPVTLVYRDGRLFSAHS